MLNVAESVKDLAAKNRKTWPAKSNRASAIGYPCLRKLVYMRTAWDKAAPISESLAGLFQTGNELEPVIERILSKAGQAGTPPWRIVGSQTVIKSEILEQYEISGHVDGILQTYDGQRWEDYGVADIKTSNPNIFQSLDGYDSLSRFPWTESYISQLSIYAKGMNQKRCVLIFVNKANLYDVKLIEWDLDEAFVDELLAKARRINEHIRSNTLPDKINRQDICGRCEHAAHCLPELEATGNLQVLADDEIADMLDRRSILEAAKREFDALERDLKKRLIEGQDVICGTHMISWKQVKKHMKATEARDLEYWQKKITSLGVTDDATDTD